MKKITTLLAAIFFMVLVSQSVASQENNHAAKNSFGSVENKNTSILAEMDFHGKNLNKFPAEILEMKDLKILDLSSNNISEIPADIKNLQNLVVLKLNGNKIYELPAEISRLKMLKEIHVDRFIWSFRMDELKKLTNARIILED